MERLVQSRSQRFSRLFCRTHQTRQKHGRYRYLLIKTFKLFFTLHVARKIWLDFINRTCTLSGSINSKSQERNPNTQRNKKMNFQAQSRMMFAPQSAQWAVHSPAQNLLMMPVRTDSDKETTRFQTLNAPARNLANLYRLNLKAQAQLQTQQIDSAIQLLKMQYDAIMSSVQKTGLTASEEASVSASTDMIASKGSIAVDQTSFAAQFELPAAKLENFDIRSSLPVETKINKRKAIHKAHVNDNCIASSQNQNDEIAETRQEKKRAKLE